MKIIPLMLLATLVMGCASAYPLRPALDAQLDIYAVVFQALIGHNASAEMPNKKGIVLCLPNSVDPDSAFLQRFSAAPIPVFPCSAYRRTDAPAQETVLTATGAPVIVFSVSNAYLSSATHAAVEGSYFEASLSAAQYFFEVELRNGKWIVVNRHMMSIS